MRVEVLVWIKDKTRGRYLGRHMDHLADSIAKLSQGRENWYIGVTGRFSPESFRSWVVSAWVDSALGRFGGSFRPIFSQLSRLLPRSTKYTLG